MEDVSLMYGQRHLGVKGFVSSEPKTETKETEAHSQLFERSLYKLFWTHFRLLCGAATHHTHTQI